MPGAGLFLFTNIADHLVSSGSYPNHRWRSGSTVTEKRLCEIDSSREIDLMHLVKHLHDLASDCSAMCVDATQAAILAAILAAIKTS